MTTVDDMAYEFRTARPEDTEAIEALDGSFTTHTIFQVAVTETGFALQEIPVDPPIHKVFPAENTADAPVAEGDPSSRTFVAVGTDGSLAGFATVSYASWNRRLAIEDIEVVPAHRGRGVGRALIGHAVTFARESGAGHIWLEVTNINTPAIHAYQRMGFTFCGLDTTLYDGTPSSGEQALYMSMPCP
ncbi:streptothricin acetyltransferase [Streptomyces ambofaciens]|uniref:Putative nourseothricin acetyltransferase n=1 Tax=Streptomyces ambofaciens TaxID=1889 RepID=Q0JWN2_STRAM|nr:GNAT family N-acetyltransferase [Streptomyces ambofaciens]ANB04007.1 streptothricin acetyltransferase [Streptomyces ambofaciens]ANB10833.1 streptothricin acetyltransferase [Streptomyces ambofaciens]CAK50894.1 putative nourseothricin acetyltransferase [Streptomyces ambofaciens]CAK51132.1 putative nourseothricin acetyltransferase [Streptomyces ambofaciens]